MPASRLRSPLSSSLNCFHRGDAELAASQARRLKYFAKSARDAAAGAWKEMEMHLAPKRPGDFL